MSDAFAIEETILDLVPDHWQRRPLWTVLKRLDVTNRPDVELLSVYRDHGVVPKNSREENYNKPSEDLTAYRFVRPGNLVLNKMKTWQGSLAVSQYQGIVSPAYIVCEVSEKVHGKYLHYLLRALPLIHLYRALSKGIRPNQWDLSFEDFSRLPVAFPPLEEQRRIADFLDAETSHIDRLCVLQAKVADTAQERYAALVDGSLDTLVRRHGLLLFRRIVVRIEQGSSPECLAVPASEGEWGVLKLSSIKRGRFVRAENKLLPPDALPLLSNEVRSGDLLITRANTPDLVGDSAVADGSGARVLLPDLIYRATLSDAMDSRFASIVVNGSRVRGLIQAVARGSSQSMVKLRGEDIKQWLVPCPPLGEQRAFVADVHRQRTAMYDLGVAVDRQLGLLAERRQTLITAAVTGQLDVTTARSGVRV